MSQVDVNGEWGTKPAITVSGQPPAGLQIHDLIVGEGYESSAGSTVTVHYVGASWSHNGRQFDSSWDRGSTLSFNLDKVIPGWTQGIPGMRIGGRRLLVIPPELGYGQNPPTSAIAVNDTLVFVIDMIGTN